MNDYDHPIIARVNRKQEKISQRGEETRIRWWQLALIGISSVIGAGFFLGSSVSLRAAGASVLLGYFVSGLAALTVFSALAEMTVNDPQLGSFRTYAREAYGQGFAFVFGWIYWFAGLLIVSSEVTALATFARYWFPRVPLWLFCLLFAASGMGIVLSGVKNFGTVESFFAIIKTSALLAFFFFTAFLFFQHHVDSSIAMHSPLHEQFFANGYSGLWRSLIFTLLSFGGIEIIGLTANRCRSDKDVLRAGFSTIVTLIVIYVVTIASVLALTHLSQIHASQSPFVTALDQMHLPYIDSLFNLIILTAAFSTMIGALYSMTTILATLADDGDAPRFLSKGRSQQRRCLGVTFFLLLILISSSYFLPKTVYEYLASAAGTMLILNWLAILLSDWKNRQHYRGRHWRFTYQPLAIILGLAIIVFSICGALLDAEQRVSILLSIGLLAALTMVYNLQRKWRGTRGKK
ncbi:MAG: amino acid permease [Sporolactobacillus sp.]